MSSSGPVVTAAVRRAKKFPGNTQEKKTKHHLRHLLGAASQQLCRKRTLGASISLAGDCDVRLCAELMTPLALVYAVSQLSLFLFAGAGATQTGGRRRSFYVYITTLCLLSDGPCCRLPMSILFFFFFFPLLFVCVVYRRRKASTRMVVVYNTHRGWVIFFFA
jgi:hypothetical protein